MSGQNVPNLIIFNVVAVTISVVVVVVLLVVKLAATASFEASNSKMS